MAKEIFTVQDRKSILEDVKDLILPEPESTQPASDFALIITHRGVLMKSKCKTKDIAFHMSNALEDERIVEMVGLGLEFNKIYNKAKKVEFNKLHNEAKEAEEA